MRNSEFIAIGYKASCIMLLILMQGCNEYKTSLIVPAPLPEPPPTTVQVPAENSEFTSDERLTLLTTTLSYHQTIGSYSKEQLAFERHQLETSLDTSIALSRIKLALLYSQPKSGFYDIGKAHTLLKSCMINNSDNNPEYYYLSNMIYAFLESRISQQRRINTIKTELVSEQNRNRELQRQLEALKAIEKTINSRSNSLTNHSP